LEKEFHYVKAPFSGILSEFRINEGAFISSSQDIGLLADNSKYIATVGLMEEDLAKFKINNKVELIDSDEIYGEVIAIDANISSEKKLCQVDILFNNVRNFQSGSFVKVYIHGEEFSEELLAPKESILQRDNKELVFVIRDNKAIWCYVTTGKSNDKYIEILDNKMSLLANEQLAIDGHYSLAHGTEVIVEK
jgi:membrane fusion protein, multidrug efflux system